MYGLAYCPAKYSEGLRSIGFADSKTLSEKQRAHLMQEILDGNAIEGKLNYAVTLMHPRDISAGMLQRANYSLYVRRHACKLLVQEAEACINHF